MAQDYYQPILQRIPDLFLRYDSPLQEIGNHLFRAFAVCALTWYGIRAAFEQAVNAARLLTLLTMLLLVGTLLTYYSQPVPGLGVSFRSLVSQQSAEMSALIANDHVERVQNTLHKTERRYPKPGVAQFARGLQRVLVFLLLGGAQAMTIGVVAFGYLVSALGGLIGPFFIPWLLVPGMDWMFWGWFKTYLQYSLYPMFAYAYTSLLSNILLEFLDPMDGASLEAMFVPLVTLLMVYIYGIWKLPAVVGSFFSGRSGDSAGPGL